MVRVRESCAASNKEMEIRLEQVYKRFGFHWIFENVNHTFKSGSATAITGANGSGKSTLMQILAGSLSPSKGTVTFSSDGAVIEVSEVFRDVSMTAPYMSIIEEFDLRETYRFHSKFRSFVDGISEDEFVELLQLKKSANKYIHQYSSGMKQRVKLGLALLSESSLVLLDEPATNLDESSTDWYLSLVEHYGKNRTLVVASNQKREYPFATNFLDIHQFKPVET